MDQVIKNWGKLFLLSSIILVVYFLSWVLIFILIDPSDRGAFGDQFGAVNALFSGLALAGVIYTLIQQQEEMSAQRREFMNSRAINLIYRQLDLINKELEQAVCLFSSNLGEDHKGIEAINQWNRMIDQGAIDQGNFLVENKDDIEKLLRVMVNSTKLLLKLKSIENMSDEDSLFIFEFFKYNLDKRLWDFIFKLNEMDDQALTKEVRSIYEYEIKRVMEFHDEYVSLNKLSSSDKKLSV